MRTRCWPYGPCLSLKTSYVYPKLKIFSPHPVFTICVMSLNHKKNQVFKGLTVVGVWTMEVILAVVELHSTKRIKNVVWRKSQLLETILKGNYNWFWKKFSDIPKLCWLQICSFYFYFHFRTSLKKSLFTFKGTRKYENFFFFWKRDIWIFHKILIFWFFFDVFFHSNHHSNSQTSHILYKHTMAILNRIWFWVSFL